MAHWRDGGIGNVAGSDDRPVKEWTLLERLASAASGKVSGLSNDNLAQAAFDEIVRLREGEIAPGCSVNAEKTVLTLYGMRYALGLFEQMAALKVGAGFRVVSREGGALTLERLETLKSAQKGGGA